LRKKFLRVEVRGWKAGFFDGENALFAFGAETGYEFVLDAGCVRLLVIGPWWTRKSQQTSIFQHDAWRYRLWYPYREWKILLKGASIARETASKARQTHRFQEIILIAGRPQVDWTGTYKVVEGAEHSTGRESLDFAELDAQPLCFDAL